MPVRQLHFQDPAAKIIFPPLTTRRQNKVRQSNQFYNPWNTRIYSQVLNQFYLGLCNMTDTSIVFITHLCAKIIVEIVWGYREDDSARTSTPYRHSDATHECYEFRPGIKTRKPSGGFARARLGGSAARLGLLGSVCSVRFGLFGSVCSVRFAQARFAPPSRAARPSVLDLITALDCYLYDRCLSQIHCNDVFPGDHVFLHGLVSISRSQVNKNVGQSDSQLSLVWNSYTLVIFGIPS